MGPVHEQHGPARGGRQVPVRHRRCAQRLDEYLKTNNLEPKALLTDGVHLNDKGCQVMAGLIDQYLVYRPELPADASQRLVRDLPVTEAMWKGGELTVEFEGNRVDIVGAGTSASEADVLIDGKRPRSTKAAT